MTQEEIQKKLKKELKRERYEHSMGVAYTAAALAMRYDVTLMPQAFLAGMLHDAAKHYSDKELLELCEKKDLPVSEAEQENPSLLHAKVGAWLARDEYDVEDEAVLSAIAYHTIGRPGMTLLEEIIYVADYMEPGRDKAKNLEQIRVLAFQNLQKTIYEIARGTISYVKEKKYSLDTSSLAVLEYYEEVCKQQGVL